MWTSTDHTLLVIQTTLLSIFFIMLIVLVVALVKLVGQVKKVVAKAENVVDSVESAAEVLRDTGGKFAFFKLIKNIVNMANGASKGKGRK